MIDVLTTLKNEMEKLNIPYTFDTWDNDVELPQFIGEISEIPNVNEDGKSEYSFILTGYATKFNGGMQQSLTNNIDIYNSNITKEIDIKEKESVNTKEKEKSIDEVISLQKEKLQEPLIEFVKMRKSIKKPITTHGLELVISKLRKLSGGHISVAEEIINQSIMNGWQGVFALKEEPTTPAKKKSDGSEYANLV